MKISLQVEVEAVAGFFMLYVLLYYTFIVTMMSGLMNVCRGRFRRR